MSKPPLNPETTPSGIAVDPRTLERVIPESKRLDGTLRKEKKIRPGYTPQEDVTVFRTARQQEMEARALPKGHIIGWVAPSSAKNNATTNSSGTLSKSQKKNEKRKEKKKADLAKKILENWDDDDEGEIKPASKPKVTTESPNKADLIADEVAEGLEKLEVNN